MLIKNHGPLRCWPKNLMCTHLDVEMVQENTHALRFCRFFLDVLQSSSCSWDSFQFFRMDSIIPFRFHLKSKSMSKSKKNMLFLDVAISLKCHEVTTGYLDTSCFSETPKEITASISYLNFVRWLCGLPQAAL